MIYHCCHRLRQLVHSQQIQTVDVQYIQQHFSVICCHNRYFNPTVYKNCHKAMNITFAFFLKSLLITPTTYVTKRIVDSVLYSRPYLQHVAKKSSYKVFRFFPETALNFYQWLLYHFVTQHTFMVFRSLYPVLTGMSPSAVELRDLNDISHLLTDWASKWQLQPSVDKSKCFTLNLGKRNVMSRCTLIVIYCLCTNMSWLRGDCLQWSDPGSASTKSLPKHIKVLITYCAVLCYVIHSF